MTKKQQPRTKQQKQIDVLCCYFFIIFFLVAVVYNLIIYAHFSSSLQLGPPQHDSPEKCSTEGFEACTTSRGECTERLSECVFPKQEEQCLYMLAYWGLDSKRQELIDKKFCKVKDKKKRKKLVNQEIQRYQYFCSTRDVQLHTSLLNSFFLVVTGLEIVVTIILFRLFFKELDEKAGQSVYCKQR